LKILAIETGTEACSAALLLEDEVRELHQLAPRQHAQLILPYVDQLLGEAGLRLGDLDAIGLGRGPGSFTGVRIAASVAQGLAFGAGIGIVPVSSLAALALDAHQEFGQNSVMAALDARMDEIYVAAFGFDGSELGEPVIEERVCPPDELVVESGRSWLGVGSGFASYGEQLRKQFGEKLHQIVCDRFPRARAVARLAAASLANDPALPPEQAIPVYLRNQVAKKPKRSISADPKGRR
jgi:tRNA threonylcarbamoyladenosine biosynthesis protein TsaB